jgi:uncharacterized damage-inducible protein DinB
MLSEKEDFLKVWEREYLTTLKVLKSFPEDKKDFKPSEKSMTALNLAWLFASEETAIPMIASGNLDWSKLPKAPETMKEVVENYEKLHHDIVVQFKKFSQEELDKTIHTMVGPKTMGDIKRMDFIRMFLLDHIHHRGQFSVYLRLVGAKVPSIYGPSADEPWM